MTILLYFIGIILLCFLMVKSTTWLIKSSTRIARFYNISEYTVSFLVIAFATSLPELLVGIVSALDKNPSLSYGNVLGSNIADLTLILAIPLLLGGGISTKEIIKNKDLVYTVFFGAFPLVLMYDGLLSRFDAILLLVAYIFYLVLVLRRSTILEAIVNNLHNIKVYKELGIFLMSILALLVSADLLVKVAENVGLLLNVPLIFIGITVTALGTSLPELVFGLKAIKTHHNGEVLGNIVGSVVANSTLVLGVTALISPISKDSSLGFTSIIFLFITLFLFYIFSITSKKLSRIEAAILITVYFVFLIVEKSLLS